MAHPALSDFEFGLQLACGSYGCVRVVRDKNLNVILAMKMMDKSRVQWRRVINEVAIHRRLLHPHVIHLHAYFETPTHHCLLLHFAVKGNLHKHLERQPMNEGMAIKLFRQIVTGVDYLHSMEIVHRDLKPDNILLDKDEVAMIANFGAAIDLATFGNIGTQAYSAPETKAFEEEFGVKADIWSLGATLLHMAIRRVPTPALLSSEKERTEAIPSTFRPGCHQLLLALLQVSPAARPSATQVLDHCWLSTK